VLGAVELAARLGERPPIEEQIACIEAPLAPHVVVAGAGSGKTQTMAMRVVWLVANGRVEPHRVLGLTFTRKAAAELGERVRSMLRRLLDGHRRSPFLADPVVDAFAGGDPTVSTYHSYAAALVGEHALRLGVEPSVGLIGEAVAWQYAAELVSAYDGPMEVADRSPAFVITDVLTLAGELAEHLASPDDVCRHDRRVADLLQALPTGAGGGGRTPEAVGTLLAKARSRAELLPLVESYQRLKRERNVLDYGDQVALAARLARESGEVCRSERLRWGAVLLDEYQDTGEAQRVLISSLFGDGHPVTAVGDPRQSIYGWRGASAGNLERFPTDLPLARGERAASTGLSRSFRNGERILAVANAIAERIPERGLAPAALSPGPGRGGRGSVTAGLFESVAEEAEWVAERIAGLAGSVPWGQVAVLSRRRDAFPMLEAQLRARGVPCEIVGLGGLLTEPEIVDIVSTLRVLGDPGAGTAAVRLLTGPRWRLGPRDLAALGRRAAAVALPGDLRVRAEVSADSDRVDERSLVEALDDLGDPSAYSEEGFRRLTALRDELRELRAWTGGPLPDLVGQVARTLLLDVELPAWTVGVDGGGGRQDALGNVERLIEVADEFSGPACGGRPPSLTAFLAYLAAAETVERGLERDSETADPDSPRVQLMTVHAAKGLEWDVVVVTGLCRRIFPVEGQPVPDWTRQGQSLPFPLRGDASELPSLHLRGAADQRAADRAIREFRDACRDRAREEEWRLAYVAATRAREMLVCTGYWWQADHATVNGPSEVLELVHRVAGVADAHGGIDPGGSDGWKPPAGSIPPWAAEPATNPCPPSERRVAWPLDRVGERAALLDAAAELVRAAGAWNDGSPRLAPEPARRALQWAREAELLLSEEAGQQAPTLEVELPGQLPVSALVTLRRDPGELARQIRRPLPAPPRPLARRGTGFHLWLEQRWGQQRLLDLDELPGAADESAVPDADLQELQEAFRRSTWWARRPVEIELPFDMVVDGVLLRGRVDAVFTDDPDGSADVVDWKTGARPTGAAAAAAGVQLAAYRLAWSALSGTPLDRIRAAFHYVRTDETVHPVDLLDGAALVDLLRSVPREPAIGG
jgi:DNA helicase-2/ATP-dependent DNA helicase PcrA